MRISLTYNLNRGICSDEQEFDVPATIAALDSALSVKNRVYAVECDRDISHWLDLLLESRPDLIFNVAEGYRSAAREAFYPALFDQLRIPYTGNDATTLLITHNKALTKRIIHSIGIPTPKWTLVSTELDLLFFRQQIRYPVFVKPNTEGSSLGIDSNSVALDWEALSERVRYIAGNFQSAALVEEYIEGFTDVSLSFVEGLFPDEIFGPVLYEYGSLGVYDFDRKRNSHLIPELLRLPQNFSPLLIQKLRGFMRDAVIALGIRGYGRADFRVEVGTEQCYFLEMNGQVELSPGAEFAFAVLSTGYSFPELVSHIAEYAAAHPARGSNAAGNLTLDQVRWLAKQGLRF